MQIIGGGKMGQALLWGLLSAEWCEPNEIVIVEIAQARRDFIEAEFPGVNIVSEPTSSPDVIVAVKPYLALEVCAALNQPKRILSIAAGISTSQIESVVPPNTSVVRAMPNTPALVNEGISGVAGGSATTAADISWASEILSAVGKVVHVEESQLDVVTGLSGSGPAYVFFVAEALAEAGVSLGLEPSTATQLSYQTLIGAARLLAEPDAVAADLRAAVTTPGGTTEAGIGVLEANEMRQAFASAVAAAASRSVELGSS